MKKGIIAFVIALEVGFTYAQAQDNGEGRSSMNSSQVQDSSFNQPQGVIIRRETVVVLDSSAAGNESNAQAAGENESDSTGAVIIGIEDFAIMADTGSGMNESDAQARGNESDTSGSASAQPVTVDIENVNVFENQDNTSSSEESSDMNADTGMSYPDFIVIENKEKVQVEHKQSTFVNILEAPFKYVGDVVGEVGEGVAHIVYSPAHGVVDLTKKGKNRNQEVTTTTTTVVTPEDASVQEPAYIEIESDDCNL